MRTSDFLPTINFRMHFLPLLILLFFSQFSLTAYKILYAEQWYNLFHQHLHRMPEDEAENLMYLEEALKAPFANPLYALAQIQDKQDWEYYRYLFKMHVNLQIIRTYRQIGTKFDREFVYFFNAPWKRQNLESLEIAEKFYKRALYFWDEAILWAEKASDKKFRWLELKEIGKWEDERIRIQDGMLDFKKILNQDLSKILEHRTQFNSMNDETY